MENNFQVKDQIRIFLDSYTVIGHIKLNMSDKVIDEYKLTKEDGSEAWLEIGEELLLMTKIEDAPENYLSMTAKENGKETVAAAYGDVDVEEGDMAAYEKKYDESTETYYTCETWDDSTEYCKGSIISENDVRLIRRTTIDEEEKAVMEEASSDDSSSNNTGSIFSLIKKVALGIIAFLLLFHWCGSSDETSDVPSIKDYLEPQGCTTVTSITGVDKDFATVYACPWTTESLTKVIIEYLEGQTSDVLENTENPRDVLILTPKECCMIYGVNDSTYVQLASRKWTVENLDAPLYRASDQTNEFYVGAYEGSGFRQDSAQYSSDRVTHHRVHFWGYPGSSSNNKYNSYSSSVRQASAATRRSSGGGHGGGGK